MSHCEDNITKIKICYSLWKAGVSPFKREWSEYAHKHIPSIRTARPYKKNEQAFIERFNGILRKECLGYLKYQKKDLHSEQAQQGRLGRMISS